LIRISYEDAVRKAVSLGGDSDTLAVSLVVISQAFYKKNPNKNIMKLGKDYLKSIWRLLICFNAKYTDS
jgi:ADP-ribosylglycohydrolase